MDAVYADAQPAPHGVPPFPLALHSVLHRVSFNLIPIFLLIGGEGRICVQALSFLYF